MFIYQYMELNVWSLCSTGFQAANNWSEISVSVMLGLEFIPIADRLLGQLMKSNAVHYHL